MSNKNCEKIDSCDSCDSCNSCNYCYSCNSCNSCDSCDSCNSCNSCDSCYSCNSCNSCDSCDSCYGLRMSEKMIFCLGEGKYESKGAGYQKNLQIFNTPITEEEYNTQIKYIKAKNFKLPIAKWVEYKDLESKDQTSTARQMGGLLKTLSYKDAWKEMWAELKQEDKNFFKNLPHFNKEIFTAITGIEDIEPKETIKIGDKTFDKLEVETALKNVKAIN